MDRPDVSPLGYLAQEGYGNKSPVVNLSCGTSLLAKQHKRWTKHDLQRYLIFFQQGLPRDRFFESFLFTAEGATSGRFLNPLFTGFAEPANQSDWKEWVHDLFEPSLNLKALQEALQDSPLSLPTVDVWITLPYPEPQQSKFGTVKGQELDFTKQIDRKRALEWWIDLFLDTWRQQNQEGHLRLCGFRWGREMLPGSDLELAEQAADIVHQRGYQLMWLTNYGTNYVINWREIGFDAVVVHPNYYGNTANGWEWIDNAAYFSAYYHCGLQIICGKGLLYDDYHMYEYLNRGLPEYRDYMRQAFLVMTFDNTDIQEIEKNRGDLYGKIHQFVKGEYRKTSYPGITY